MSAERVTTFQEMHRRRQRAAFVGRVSEIQQFEQNLALPSDDPQRRSIVAISGQGGMGKTTLLGRCREICQAAGFATTRTDEEEKDLLAVMSRLADRLERPADFSEFRERLAKYREMRHSLESHPEAPEDFSRVMGATAGRVGVKLARRIPVAGMAFDFVDEEGMGAQFGEFAAFVLKRTGKREDANLILEPLEVLSPLFLDGLQRVMCDTPVGLFFDTFEQTQHMVEPWLFRVLAGHFGDLPIDVLIAVAGRYPLNLNSWSLYEQTMLRMELQPFSTSEAKNLLARDGITERNMVDELIRLSHGLPILLASLAAGNPDHAQVADTAVERVLQSAPEPLRRASIEASLPRMLNRDVGRIAIDQPDSDTAFDWLVGMPFVLNATNGWKYHDVIRSEFLAHGRRESPDKWLAAHKRLSEYYEDKRDELRDSIDTEQAVRAEVEHIYHGVCTGSNDELAYAISRCIQSWTLQPAVTVFWAMTIRDAERDSGRDGSMGWGEAWLDAVNAMVEGHERGTIPLFTKAIDSELLSESNRVTALMARSDLYFRQSRLDAALEDINEAIELREDNPRLRHERSWVYWRAEMFDKALADCKAAVELLDESDPRYTTYRVMEVCVRSENLEASAVLELINKVPRIEEDSWGLLTRGTTLLEVGATDAGIRDLKRVIALKKGRVEAAWMALGQTYERKQDFRQAVSAFRSALEADVHLVEGWCAFAFALARENEDEQVEEMLSLVGKDDEDEDESIRAYRALGLLEVDLPKAARRELELAIQADPSRAEFRLWMGRVFMLESRWGDALREVEKALQLRPKWPEALATRGLCRSYVNDHSGALEDWAEAERIDPVEAKTIDPNERGLALSVNGQYREAIKTFDRVKPDERSPFILYNRAVARAMEFGVKDARDDLLAAIEVLKGVEEELVKSYGIAGIKCVLEEDDQALAGLARACKEDAGRVSRWARTDPAWGRIRGSKMFEQVLATADGAS